MGTFTFKWPYPAEEVYVTGTFDKWSKTEKLEKVGDVFEKTVTLPDSSEKITYKFVVDGDWKADDAAPKEADDSGIFNNVLMPEDIVKAAPPTTAIMSTVGPEATTAQLAKDVPLEKKDEAPAGLPGTFPETPMTELDKEVQMINPLPAADGAVNPIKLAPGEKVPETVAAGGVNSHVKLDKESYEKADTLPGVSTELPPVSKNMIPESSLPIVGSNDVTINTVGPGATAAALAAKVPLEEHKVPEVVKESQEKAGVDPEASGISEEVKEKEQVEEELLKKVPEVPSTAEGTSGKGTEKSEKDKTITETVAATAAGLGETGLATVIATKDKVVEQTSVAGAKLLDSAKQALPASVQESIKEAGKSTEAAANTEAVEEKKVVETQLLKEVKPAEPNGTEPKASAEAATESPTKTNGAETIPVKEAETKAPETPAKASTSAPTEATPSSSKAAESPATMEKKKSRLSTIISKIKHKVSSKDKA